jgi:hypothetical protein
MQRISVAGNICKPTAQAGCMLNVPTAQLAAATEQLLIAVWLAPGSGDPAAT